MVLADLPTPTPPDGAPQDSALLPHEIGPGLPDPVSSGGTHQSHANRQEATQHGPVEIEPVDRQGIFDVVVYLER